MGDHEDGFRKLTNRPFYSNLEMKYARTKIKFIVGVKRIFDLYLPLR